MTRTTQRRTSDHGADPWWGDDPVAAVTTASAAPAATGSRRRRSRARSGAGWLVLGIVIAPFDLLRRLLARSPRLRRFAIRTAVLFAALTVLACSVGVILINNLVISRTAELGELDTRRRELRRDNALLAAEARKRSGPDVVFRRAERELGMVRTPDVPKFVWAVAGSRQLTALQRRRAAAVQQRRAAAATDTTTSSAAGSDRGATATPAAAAPETKGAE